MGVLSDLNRKRKEAQRKLKDEFLGFTSSASRKLIPRELRPALPFLSAAVPFMVPAQGIFAGPLGRAILSSGTNLLAQGLSDPEAEDLNLLSAGLAGLTGALSSPEVSGSMRSGIEKGITGVDKFGDISVPYTEGPGFLQGAENIGREGIASMSDFVTGTGETFRKFGRDPGALFDAGVKGARFPGLKELGTAITIPAAQGTGDFAYTEAQKALRAFNKNEAEEMARAGADMEAIASARRSAIREAMEVSGFEEDEIMETLGELGLKEGGIVNAVPNSFAPALVNICPGLDANLLNVSPVPVTKSDARAIPSLPIFSAPCKNPNSPTEPVGVTPEALIIPASLAVVPGTSIPFLILPDTSGELKAPVKPAKPADNKFNSSASGSDRP